MIGQGSMEKKCLDYIEENELKNTVSLTGFQENPFPFLKNSRLMIMPSQYEGLPMAAVEALALGTPVLCSGAGGLQSLFEGHPDYIASNLEEYSIKALQILSKDKYLTEQDCKSISKPYTDMKGYMDDIYAIYDAALE